MRPVMWKTILKRIDECMSMRRQWKEMELFSNAAEYEWKALALIELLEVDLCGSTGGFDLGQTDRSLAARIAWLNGKIQGKKAA
jgi:hypothetical protein